MPQNTSVSRGAEDRGRGWNGVTVMVEKHTFNPLVSFLTRSTNSWHQIKFMSKTLNKLNLCNDNLKIEKQLISFQKSSTRWDRFRLKLKTRNILWRCKKPSNYLKIEYGLRRMENDILIMKLQKRWKVKPIVYPLRFTKSATFFWTLKVRLKQFEECTLWNQSCNEVIGTGRIESHENLILCSEKLKWSGCFGRRNKQNIYFELPFTQLVRYSIDWKCSLSY